MNYRLVLFFLLVVLLGNFILSPLFGVGESFLVVIFLATLIVAVKDYRSIIILGLLASFIEELLGGFGLGVFIMSFFVAFVLYVWLDRFLSLKPSQHRQGKIIYQLSSELLSVVCLTYIFYILAFTVQKVFYDGNLEWDRLAPIFQGYMPPILISVQSGIILSVVEYLNNKKRSITSSPYARI